MLSRSPDWILINVLAGFSLVLVLNACSDGSDRVPVGNDRKPQPDNPLVTGPITGGGDADCCTISFAGIEIDLRSQGYVPGTPFYSGYLAYDPADIGYVETEFFFEGTAQSYINTDELPASGEFAVQAADTASYRSRMVVMRPIEDADFNGTVVVEWFNVTGGLDASPDWSATHTELTREGYVWVGVSAQSVGIEGGGAFDIPLKSIDPDRYGSLSHPGDSFSYDIFSQAAQSVRRPAGVDPLSGLQVERVLAMGQSQSASRLVTYYNAVQPTVDVFDGFLIHSRGSGASSLSQSPQAEIAVPRPGLVRQDLPEPSITLQAETDVFLLGSEQIRQPDGPSYRLWEMAGTAHSDIYTTLKAGGDTGMDSSVADVIEEPEVRPPFISCPFPANDGPMHWIAKASIHALDQWVRTGQAPPTAPLLEFDETGEAFAYDAVGNVLGGIRSPYVDAPVAVLSGEGQPADNGFCRLFGTTALFQQEQIDGLYENKQAYIEAIDSAADDAVSAGFLRPADADLIKARARSSDIAGPPAP